MHDIKHFDTNTDQSTFIDVIRSRAKNQHDLTAFTFISDKGDEKTNSTYYELDKNIKNIAAILQRQNLKGERAVLLFPTGKDFVESFLGCLYAGVIAIPVSPPDHIRFYSFLQRLKVIVDDSQANVILTNSQILKIFTSIKDDYSLLKNLRNYPEQEINNTIKLSESLLKSLLWIQTDTIEEGYDIDWIDPNVNSETIAYLQYTSGSTGSPKGVVITHNNILINSKMKEEAFGVNYDWEGVSWLPVYHDMGLVGGIFQPLYSGFKCTLMSPSSFLSTPSKWLKIISEIKDKPVISGGPNFAYELCIRRISYNEESKIDLSNWVIAFNGSEPVRMLTMEKFHDKFKRIGFKKEAFYPCYGLAEATLFVSGGNRSDLPVTLSINKNELKNGKISVTNNERDIFTVVSCGYSREDGTIKIVNPETKEICPSDQVGEVWFSSKTVAREYWNKPDESARIFNNFIENNPKQPFLRTGDLGFLKDGQLYITGRLKDLIIIRGKNHYPQDIEYTIENSHPSIRKNSVAAFSVDEEQKECLVIVLEINSEKDVIWDDIVYRIRDAVNYEHDLHINRIIFLKPKTLFKTSSGKIQRGKVKSAYINGELDFNSEWKSKNENDIEYKGTDGNNQSHVIVKNDLSEFTEISDWLINHLASVLKVKPSEIDINKPFSSYGIDSLMAVEFAAELEKKTGKKMSSTIIWEYSTINKLAGSIIAEANQSGTDKKLQFHSRGDELIAVIGMACRFPGANNPEEFWELLQNATDPLIEIPKERWNIDEFYDENPDTPGKIVSRWGGFLKDIDKFDPKFFGISPREAAQMDPQQRILLEVFWELLENSHIIPEKLAGTKTGIFLGISNHDYSQYQYCNYDSIDVYGGTGNSFSIAANRISYLFDLHGPSLPVDTACSSSLVAVHLACQSLLRAESDNAIAGGVNLILTPEVSISFTKGKMLSPDGRCKTFDAGANGYVRSEGCGMVMLKRLSDAVKDGNDILAVIRGTAINQDGHSNGLTAPNKAAQQQVINEALKNANVPVNQISYIEAHGTGTILGDPIEIDAIKEVFKNRLSKYPITIGSVKSNIGHLESAAGIAGLIKTILMLKHKQIPANLHFHNLNPYIHIDESLIRIASIQRNWEVNGDKRIAGISAFGFGGVNAHVIIEELPDTESKKYETERPLHLLALSAKDEKSLLELTKLYQNDLATKNNKPLTDICFSANSGRTHFTYRTAFIGCNKEEIINKINHHLKDQNIDGFSSIPKSSKGKYKTAMLFTGQGAQYIGMGKLLYGTHPMVREILDFCNEILNEYLDKPLLKVIFTGQIDEINNTYYTQPALFVIEYALAKLWMSWGIKPDYLIGHSIGEYAAACLAEVFSLEDALKLVSARGKLMHSLSGEEGTMASIFTGKEIVEEKLAGYESNVSIAAINGYSNIVISGESERVKRIVQGFKEQGIHSQLLKVSHAFHSPLMDPILDEFELIADSIKYNLPKIPIISNLTGRIVENGKITDGKYWRDHIRNPVLFADGIKVLAQSGVDIFIETGPNPILIGMGKSCLPDLKALWIPSLKKEADDWQILLESLAKLYTYGVDINWKGFDRYYNRKVVQLPNYPFKKEKYWTNTLAKQKTERNEILDDKKNKLHPLVHSRLISPLIKEIVFESRFSAKINKLLNDHRIFGKSIMPEAGFIEMILAAVKNIIPNEEYCLENFIIHEPMIIPEEQECIVQIILNNFNERYSIKIFSATCVNNNNPEWKLNATGEIIHSIKQDLKQDLEIFDFENNEFTSEDNIDITDFYKKLNEIGYEHGRSFSILKQIWGTDEQALGNAELNEPQEFDQYIYHPGLIDAGLQLLTAIFIKKNQNLHYNKIYIPTGFDSFRIHKSCTSNRWIRIICQDEKSNYDDYLNCDLKWYDNNGALTAEIKGQRFKAVNIEALLQSVKINLNDWLYEINWYQKPLPENSNNLSGRNWIIFSDDKGYGELLYKALVKNNNICEIIKPGMSFRLMDDGCYEINPDNIEDYDKLLNKIYSGVDNKIDGIIYLWGLNSDVEKVSSKNFTINQSYLYKGILNLLHQLVLTANTTVSRIYLVTSESQYVVNTDEVKNFIQAPLWGFGRVLANEHPEYHCTVIDLDEKNTEDSISKIAAEIEIASKEDQIAYRDGKRYAARLGRRNQRCGTEELTQLEIKERGTLSNLIFTRYKKNRLKDDEVEIEVKAAGLNFRDIMNALGLYPGEPGLLGGECSGIVSAIGGNVKSIKVGDSVFGIAQGCFSNYVITKEGLIVSKPENIDYLEAATIPVAFLTAHYTLNKLAKISSEDKILIHSASGGVGSAAIQIARLAGADIFATVGNIQKQEYLQSLGIKYVMNSRSQGFVDEVKSYSKGAGVDIVLNSLNGEYIPNGLLLLKQGGRFIELGKTGIWDEEKVKSFRNDIFYYTIALDEICRSNCGLIHSMLIEIKEEIEHGKLKPLAITEFPLEKAEEAFRYMMKAEHIGKIVLTAKNNIGLMENKYKEIRIEKNGSYLISGGLGALGLKTAEWLSFKGAGQIIFLGRNAPSSYAEVVISNLKDNGTEVLIINADVSKKTELENALGALHSCGVFSPPLKGVVHAAGILDNGIIIQQTWDKFQNVTKPKIEGAINLYHYYERLNLDFVIYFSSVASILGSPGQSNYACANSFLDSFAHYQRGKGINAVSINWCVWKDLGMAKVNNIQNLIIGELGSILPNQGLTILDKVLKENIAQFCVIPADWENFNKSNRNFNVPLLISEHINLSNKKGDDINIKSQLTQVLRKNYSMENKAELIEILEKQLKKVLGLDTDAPIEITQPLQEMGLDSLMAIELKNEIRNTFGKDIPTTLLFNYPSIDAISDYLITN